jgi:predicted site-specific integrase-resolvase
MSSKVLTVAEAAQITGKSKRTIYAWIQRGELKPIRSYIDLDDLLETERKMSDRRGRPRKEHADE